jgi:hypothetical protein
MNPIHPNNSHDEVDRFDRLVDGELSETERRSLLTSLDAKPDGWRRCALAFLEAQTFRESFGDFSPPAEKPANVPTPALSNPLPKSKKKLGAMGIVMAMAASFLVVFALGGWLLQNAPNGGSTTPGNNLIANNSDPSVSSSARNVLPNGNPSIKQPPTASPTPWQMVRLQAPALTGNNEPLQLPAMPRERLDEEFLRTVSNPMPDAVRKAFERSGYEIRMHREFVPVRLDDGRQLVVPVDQFNVEYDMHPTN